MILRTDRKLRKELTGKFTGDQDRRSFTPAIIEYGCMNVQIGRFERGVERGGMRSKKRRSGSWEYPDAGV
jgi:hypothetical protein